MCQVAEQLVAGQKTMAFVVRLEVLNVHVQNRKTRAQLIDSFEEYAYGTAERMHVGYLGELVVCGDVLQTLVDFFEPLFLLRLGLLLVV